MKKLLFSLTLFVMVGGGCEAAHAQTLQPQGGTMVRPGSIGSDCSVEVVHSREVSRQNARWRVLSSNPSRLKLR